MYVVPNDWYFTIGKVINMKYKNNLCEECITTSHDSLRDALLQIKGMLFSAHQNIDDVPEIAKKNIRSSCKSLDFVIEELRRFD